MHDTTHTWSANRINPRVQPIAEKHAILEIVSANSSRARFSHVFFSQSALAISAIKTMLAFHLAFCV